MGSSWKHGFHYEVEAEAAEKEEERLRALAGEGTVDSSQQMRAEVQQMREHAAISRDKKALLADIDKHIKNLETLQKEPKLSSSQQKRLADKLSVMKAARADVASDGQTNLLAEAVAKPNSDYKKGIFSKTERLVNKAASLYQRAKKSPVNFSWEKIASIVNQNRKGIKDLPELSAKLTESQSALKSLHKITSGYLNRLAEIQQRQMQLLTTTKGIKHTPEMNELRASIISLKARNAEIENRSVGIMKKLGEQEAQGKKPRQELERERKALEDELFSNLDSLSSKQQQYDKAIREARKEAVAPEQKRLEQEAEGLRSEHMFAMYQKQALETEINEYSRLQQVMPDPLFVESQTLMALKEKITELEARVATLTTPTEGAELSEQTEALERVKEQLNATKIQLDNEIKHFLSKHPEFGAQQHTLEKEILKHLVTVSGKKSDKSIDKTAVLSAALDFVRMPTEKNYKKLEEAKAANPLFNVALFGRSATDRLVKDAIQFKELATRVEEDVKKEFLSGPSSS